MKGVPFALEFWLRRLCVVGSTGGPVHCTGSLSRDPPDVLYCGTVLLVPPMGVVRNLAVL